MNQRAIATLRVTTTCQREGCGKEHLEQRELDLGPWGEGAVPLQVKPQMPPGWHSIDRRWFCSLDCTARVIEEAVRRAKERPL